MANKHSKFVTFFSPKYTIFYNDGISSIISAVIQVNNRNVEVKNLGFIEIWFLKDSIMRQFFLLFLNILHPSHNFCFVCLKRNSYLFQKIEMSSLNDFVFKLATSLSSVLIHLRLSLSYFRKDERKNSDL